MNLPQRDPVLEALARQPMPAGLFLWHTRKWLKARIGLLPKAEKKSRRPSGQAEFQFSSPASSAVR